jgi:hypothetical protein
MDYLIINAGNSGSLGKDAIKAFKDWLEDKYKEYYDPHEEFVCPPATTVDGLIRELNAELVALNANQQKAKE